MKKLIYQYFSGENDYPLMSSRSIKAYAEKYGCDYKYIVGGHPIRFHYGIFLPFLDNSCDNYDAILFLDTDMLATQCGEDVFDYMTDDIGIWHLNDGPAKPKEKKMVDEHSAVVCPKWMSKGHGNTGTVLFPRAVYLRFKAHIKNLAKLDQEARKAVNLSPGNHPLQFGGWDQYVVNSFNYERGVNFLNCKFNWHLNQLPMEGRWDATFIHYHGNLKDMLRKEFNDGKILK